MPGVRRGQVVGGWRRCLHRVPPRLLLLRRQLLLQPLVREPGSAAFFLFFSSTTVQPMLTSAVGASCVCGSMLALDGCLSMHPRRLIAKSPDTPTTLPTITLLQQGGHFFQRRRRRHLLALPGRQAVPHAGHQDAHALPARPLQQPAGRAAVHSLPFQLLPKPDRPARVQALSTRDHHPRPHRPVCVPGAATHRPAADAFVALTAA
jgi:hypothetical protein